MNAEEQILSIDERRALGARMKEEAAERSEQRKQARLQMKADLALWIEEYDLRFTYIHSEENQSVGGATIAWARHQGAYPNFKLIKVSIAWCTPTESFDKTLGRWVAAKAFIEGHWTNMRINDARSHVSSQLQSVFQYQV